MCRLLIVVTIALVATAADSFAMSQAHKSLDRRSSSLGEIASESYYHNNVLLVDDTTNAPWRRGSRSAHSDCALSLAAPGTRTRNADAYQEEPVPPLLTFGVIADIQYAPIGDGFSYGGVPRYYRHALSTAKHAAEHFQEHKVPLVINLGDIIDGKCQEVVADADTSQQREERNCNPGRNAVLEVIDALSAYSHGDILHTYGNHELYNLDREEMGSLLQIPFVREPCGDLVGYRSHSVPEAGIKFVVLDSYDITIEGRCEQTSAKRKQAEELLAKHNPNYPENENSPEGMDGLQRRYVGFNGAVGKPQMEWLRDTLEEAKANKEKVILLSHQPIYPDSSNAVCLVWNFQEILTLLRAYPCTVIASFAGHAHKGGYKRCEESGIHFRVFEAALESPDPIKTYGLVDVYHDRLEVRGMGDCKSAVYNFDHMARPEAACLSIPEDEALSARVPYSHSRSEA